MECKKLGFILAVMAVVALLTAVAAPTAMAARNEVNLIPLVADNCLPSGSSCSMWFGESCCKGFCILLFPPASGPVTNRACNSVGKGPSLKLSPRSIGCSSRTRLTTVVFRDEPTLYVGGTLYPTLTSHPSLSFS
ncbi:hypothetical protein V6N13_117307 [Hibiscus sabdariffa]